MARLPKLGSSKVKVSAATRDEVLAACERERAQIAQKLHDGLGQQMAGVGLMAKALLHGVNVKKQAALHADVQRVIAQITEAVGLAREMSRDLEVLQLAADQFGATMRSLARRVEDRSNVSCTFRGDEALKGGTEATLLYRIAQDTVENALAHHAPSRISISLGRDPGSGRMMLVVQDDGIGSARPAKGGSRALGRRIMQYRAASMGGRLVVEDDPAGGTVAKVLFGDSILRGRRNRAPREG